MTAQVTHASAWQRVPVLLALGLTALVYHPLLYNYFWSDDFLNLYHIVNISLPEYLLTPHGGHMLVTRNAMIGTHRDLAAGVR